MSTRKILTPPERFLPEEIIFSCLGRSCREAGTWGAWVQDQGLLLPLPFLLPSINGNVDASRSEWEGITPSCVIFFFEISSIFSVLY